MASSAAPSRATVTNRTPWTMDKRVVLYLLFEMWELDGDEITAIFHAIFPENAGYNFTRLRDQYQQRWAGGRHEIDWRSIDRPNQYDDSELDDEELEAFATAFKHIDKIARSLGIRLVLKVSLDHDIVRHMPLGYGGKPGHGGGKTTV